MSVVAVIPQWFTTKRGAAMGFSSAGTGIGGLALSPMVKNKLKKQISTHAGSLTILPVYIL
jgi:nitrate/nitrite transporter NarK